MLDYDKKDRVMNLMLEHFATPTGFRSKFKGVPIGNYEVIKQFIDFTKYFVMFRGPRHGAATSTRKCDAKAFDVYKRNDRDIRELRLEREAFNRGVEWANSRS